MKQNNPEVYLKLRRSSLKLSSVGTLQILIYDDDDDVAAFQNRSFMVKMWQQWSI